jgi:thiol-disulfide isomerase/thioredoxin
MKFPGRRLAATRPWLISLAILSLWTVSGCSRPAAAEAQSDGASADQSDAPGQARPGPADRGTAPPESSRRPAEPEFAVEDPKDPSPFRVRVKAPPLDGGLGWINTDGPLRLEDLRGKFVLLDFWTYCCINCIQLLPELKKLEAKYPNELVVIGVHSAKFDGEKQTQNIAEAVARYEIAHPVVNDGRHAIWDRFGVNAWPTMMIIDPQGYLVATHSGEIDVEALEQFFKSVMPYYQRRKLLDKKPHRWNAAARKPETGGLRFPGKVLADEGSKRLFITDSGNNRIVIAGLDGQVLDVIGDGQAGDRDGDFSKAQFNHPQGTALVGDALYVADTENHLIRRVDLKKKRVTTVAGTGKQGRGAWPGIDEVRQDAATGQLTLPKKWQALPRKARLASPWALAADTDWLYIAMAGDHQIWRMALRKPVIEVYAGDGREDIRDGKRVPQVPPRLDPLSLDVGFASFAQPSGLAMEGKTMYVADSEGSAIRAVPLEDGKPVSTVVGPIDMPRGRALFTFGDVDGVGGDVRLQHVLGVAAHDGQLYIADTYNNKIKKIDLATRKAETISGTGTAGREDAPAQFDEPAGISYAAGKLYVADTNNHAIRTVELKLPYRVETLTLKGLETPSAQPSSDIDPFVDAVRVNVSKTTCAPSDGKIHLKLKLLLPDGWKTNPLGPMAYRLAVSGDAGPIDSAALNKVVEVAADKRNADLELAVPLKADRGQVKLRVALAYFYCQSSTGICKTGGIEWTVPVVIGPAAPGRAIVLEHPVDPNHQ